MIRRARFGLPLPLRRDMIETKEAVIMRLQSFAEDYQRIEKAILFLEKNALRKPDLKEIAKSANLS